MKTKKLKLFIGILLSTNFRSTANPGMPPPGLPPATDPVNVTINQDIFILMSMGILLGLFILSIKI